jgi:acyl transferase domain-containing protein
MAAASTSCEDSIAIVGMSCRLSGGVSTLDDFWNLLSRSRDGWRPMPDERFSSNAYHHPNPQKKGCFNQKGGYFMQKDLSEFDAPFFQITEQEALAMGQPSFICSLCWLY